MQVGIPRSLSFYYLFALYRTFLHELGIGFVETCVSTAKDFENFNLCPTDEPCISVKTAFSHSANLLEQGVDALFVPAIVSLEPSNYCCPKMMGLPSMLKAGLELPDSKIISPVIDVKDNPDTWESTWVEAGRNMGVSDERRIRKALRKAITAWRQTEQKMHQFAIPVSLFLNTWSPFSESISNGTCFSFGSGHDDETTLQSNPGCKSFLELGSERYMTHSGALGKFAYSRGKHLSLQKLQANISKENHVEDVTAVMGHSYLLNDIFGKAITEYVSSYGPVVFPEMISRDDSRKHIATIFEGEKMWTIEGHILGSCLHLIRNRKIGRLILITAFSCGPLSIIENYVAVEADKYKVPVLYLSIDEHTGEAGLITRLEAFMDSCKARQKHRLEQNEGQIGDEYVALCESEHGTHVGTLKVEAVKPNRANLTPFAKAANLEKEPIGVVNMGNLDIPVATLLREFGVDVRLPGNLTDDVVNLGKELAPEFICYPMVTLLGQMRCLVSQGVSRIIMVQGKGKCRLGWYAQVMEIILHRAGFAVEVIAVDSPFPLRVNGQRFLNQWKQIVGAPKVSTVFKAITLTLQKQVLIDKSHDILRDVRAKEKVRGTGDKRHKRFLRELDTASGLVESREIFNRYKRDMKSIPSTLQEPLKIAIVGEIYVVNEPFVNKEVEKMLGFMEQRVRVYRKLDVISWLNCHIFKTPRAVLDYHRVAKAANRYIPVDVGGHGQESVGEAVLASKAGMDGVLHLFPFTCMPEIIAQSILVKVSGDLDIPVLSLMISEQTGIAGLKTRLEAFCDLLDGRRKSLRRL